jgi:hypothetical protein
MPPLRMAAGVINSSSYCRITSAGTETSLGSMATK